MTPAHPVSLTNIGIVSGLTTGQKLVAIDFESRQRPTLWTRLCRWRRPTVQRQSDHRGRHRPVDSASTKLAGTKFALNADPVTDNFRVVDDAGENLRINPLTGALLSTDTSISPSNDSITAMAYNNNFPSTPQTTLYGDHAANDKIVTIGSLGGIPNSPNGGQVNVIGSSTVHNSTAGADLGFAIDANGAAYLNIVVGGTSGLYSANLTSGAVTNVGSFATGVTMADITVAPAVSFSITGFPARSTQGSASNIIVTAQTVYGTTATGYSGTVHFTSSDAGAVLPSNTLLTNGSDTVSVTLNTPGVQSITATDTVSNFAPGSQTGITVIANTELVGLTTGNQLGPLL